MSMETFNSGESSVSSINGTDALHPVPEMDNTTSLNEHKAPLPERATQTSEPSSQSAPPKVKDLEVAAEPNLSDKSLKSGDLIESKESDVNSSNMKARENIIHIPSPAPSLGDNARSTNPPGFEMPPNASVPGTKTVGSKLLQGLAKLAAERSKKSSEDLIGKNVSTESEPDVSVGTPGEVLPEGGETSNYISVSKPSAGVLPPQEAHTSSYEDYKRKTANECALRLIDLQEKNIGDLEFRLRMCKWILHPRKRPSPGF